MKHLLIIPAVLLFVLVHGQTVKIEKVDGVYIAQGVLQFDSISSDQLFKRSLMWLTRAYRSAKDAIQLTDKETEKIVARGTFQTELFFHAGFVEDTLVMEFKPGKIKYHFSDMNYVPPGGKDRVYYDAGMLFKRWALKKATKDLQLALDNLTGYINSHIAPDDNW